MILYAVCVLLIGVILSLVGSFAFGLSAQDKSESTAAEVFMAILIMLGGNALCAAALAHLFFHGHNLFGG